jgi:hypothetical protein
MPDTVKLKTKTDNMLLIYRLRHPIGLLIYYGKESKKILQPYTWKSKNKLRLFLSILQLFTTFLFSHCFKHHNEIIFICFFAHKLHRQMFGKHLIILIIEKANKFITT